MAAKPFFNESKYFVLSYCSFNRQYIDNVRVINLGIKCEINGGRVVRNEPNGGTSRITDREAAKFAIDGCRCVVSCAILKTKLHNLD